MAIPLAIATQVRRRAGSDVRFDQAQKGATHVFMLLCWDEPQGVHGMLRPDRVFVADGVHHVYNRIGRGERLWCRARWLMFRAPGRVSFDGERIERGPRGPL